MCCTCSFPKWIVPLQPIFQNVVVMDPFLAYSIPIQGLKVGVHKFNYLLDRAFFRHFDNSPIADGQLEVDLLLDKRSDMLLLDFAFKGYSYAECDRCTASIRLPLSGNRQLVIKYGHAEGVEEDEVVFISREASVLKIADYLYEFAILTLPITNTYDCENDPNPPCNREILNYLNQGADEQNSNPVWDALKGLK